MSNILAIFKKEFRGYFASPIAYIYLIVYLVLTGFLFFRVFFLNGQVSLRLFFDILPWVFLFFVPAIAMRMWAEEKRTGTIELLMTLPVKDREAVIGKYLAALVFLVVSLVLTFPLPVIAANLGRLDPGPLWGGYLGAVLMGAAYLAIGVFVSSITRNQIVAYIVGVSFIFILFIMSTDVILFAAPHFLVPLLEYLGLSTHFDSVGRGVVDSRDLVYYASLIGFFLFLNVQAVQNRKWK
jgi:ABC-2 type transport system permease protein